MKIGKVYYDSFNTMESSSGFVIWLTGLPASGKSSLAAAMQRQLRARQIPTVILDSDELRQVLTPHPDYTGEERAWFYNVLTFFAAHLARSSVNVLIAATGNLRAYRYKARQSIPCFAEVYLQCPLLICQQRDPKGLYAQATRDEVDYVPGIDVPYEPPFAPEVTIDMHRLPPEAAASSVIRRLQLIGVIREDTHGRSFSPRS